MATPLMMLGPGGDYTTRFDVKGNALVKSNATATPATAGYDPDADSAGTMSAWARLRRRGKDVEKSRKTPIHRPADRFEHTQPAAPATYARATPGQLQQKLALIQAGELWLAGQLDAIDDLAGDQTRIERVLAEAARPEATVRVIRWNGSTMTLPRPVAGLHAPRPLPEHAFTNGLVTAHDPQPAESSETVDPDAVLAVNPTGTPTPSPTDDHTQPYPQADEDPHDDPRLAAVPWLFTDHAGAGRRARRVQGHGLRARRSTHQKGLPGPGCEQSSLFGAVA